MLAWFTSGGKPVAGYAFLASILVLGLPHGGCDPLIPYWQRWGIFKSSGVLVAYLLAAAGMAVLWWWWADLAIVIFLVITAWHWGTTDALALRMRYSFLWGMGRGLLITGAVSGWQPEATQMFFKTLVNPAGLTHPVTQFGGWIALLGIMMECLALILTRYRSWLPLVIESFVIMVLFAVAHPLLAITAYFVGLHSVRSVSLLENKLPSWLRERRWLGFHLAALPGSLAVLLLLPFCARFLPESTQGLDRWVASYFILLSVLTLPHAVLFTMVVDHAKSSNK